MRSNDPESERTQPGILLNHAPTRLPIVEQAGFSLQLSGHTHGGQFLPYTWITRRIYGRFTRGLHRFGSLQVYTSTGAGTWGPPMRVGTRPEIVLLDFNSGFYRLGASERMEKTALSSESNGRARPARHSHQPSRARSAHESAPQQGHRIHRGGARRLRLHGLLPPHIGTLERSARAPQARARQPAHRLRQIQQHARPAGQR
jgi:hypothetical protein